ncbi:MAG: ATP-binding protein [Bacteroidales bacterium]|nr:ATP-binding protein [Bacteroidales bacterium]
MIISRSLKKTLKQAILQNDQVVLLYGARQTGKTTLIKAILEELSLKHLAVNADELRYMDVLSSRDVSKMSLLVEGLDLLYIDEAQRIPDAGINVKLLHDHFPKLKIILTGSSSLELANRTREPLTGRTNSFTLFPVAIEELLSHYNKLDLDAKLEEFLIYGNYPDILTTANAERKQKKLYELTSSYLYKDVLELTNIRNSRKISDLLKLLAYQIGSLVSMNELASSLQMSKETVSSYIDLMEKSFVLFRLGGFSRNLHKELTKMDKLYFCDLGIRNALINNFNPLSSRNDQGQLWENFLIIERQKRNSYRQAVLNPYYWRTYSGPEIDLIEEKGGELSAYEVKFGTKISKEPLSWRKAYPTASFSVINRENYLSFITG